MIFRKIFETFNDLSKGRLTDDDLKKGQKLRIGDKFVEVSATVFHNSITKIKQNDLERKLPKGLDTLTVYSKEEYRTKRCFLGPNNSSGYALTKDGELVSVFSSQKSSGNALVADAVKRERISLIVLHN